MPHTRDKKSLLAINLGLGINILLSVLKTSIGVLGHSPALLAEGINSTSDVAYCVVARVFMHLAKKPADIEHPYGHRQLESIASLIVGAFVVATAVAVFWDAVDKMWDLLDGEMTSLGTHPLALWVALLTVAIKTVLFFYIRKLGKETHNPMVNAMAYDHRNDVYSASAASLGIFLGQNGYPWVDPLAGALVALLILRTGAFILRESSVDLMGVIPSKELTEQIIAILEDLKGVKHLEEMQASRFGPHIVINLTIGIDGNITVREGDVIATRVEGLIYESLPNVMRVHIHYHPTNDQKENMTVDEILVNSQQRTSPYQAEYFE